MPTDMAETPVVEQAAADQARRADQADRDTQRGDSGNRSSSKVLTTEGAPTVVALMGVTVVFALIGNELDILAGTTKPGKPGGGNVITAGGKIIVGGFVATTLLVLLTHAGEVGRQTALGLALVTMVTTTLVYGGPVWLAMNNAFGSSGSTPTTPNAIPSPTAPTGNTSTTNPTPR